MLAVLAEVESSFRADPAHCIALVCLRTDSVVARWQGCRFVDSQTDSQQLEGAIYWARPSFLVHLGSVSPSRGRDTRRIRTWSWRGDDVIRARATERRDAPTAVTDEKWRAGGEKGRKLSCHIGSILAQVQYIQSVAVAVDVDDLAIF